MRSRQNSNIRTVFFHRRGILFMVYGLLCLVFLSRCTGFKALEDGEKMFTGYQIKVEEDTAVKKSRVLEIVNDVIEPQPNETLLGRFRPGPAIYHLAGTPKKEKGFRNWLKNSIGSAPVTLKDVEIKRTTRLIKNRLQNAGYFTASVSSNTKEKKKSAEIIYSIDANRPYRFRKYILPDTISKLASQINSMPVSTFIKQGDRYSLEALKEERGRIGNYLKNQGYFYFDKDFLLFQADTTVGDHQVDVYLKLKGNTPQKAQTAYSINEVTVLFDQASQKSTALDTLKYEDKRFVAKDHEYRPSALARYIFLEKGDTFSYNSYLETLNKFIDLNVFRFVNVRFNPVDSTSERLNTEISLVSLSKKNLRASLGPVSRSNNFVGSEIQGSFRNRNVFQGAEELSVNLNAGFETQFSNAQDQKVNAISFGAEVALNIPHFITPFKIKNYSRRYIPRTVIELGFDYQKRTSFYELNSLNLTYAYRWRETSTRRHELALASIEYSRLGNTSADFEALLENNQLLRLSFQNQFILSTQYNFFYDNQIKNNRHRIYWNPAVDVSGNLMSGLQSIFGNGNGESDTREVLGLPYAQYFKISSDLRYFQQISSGLVWASRFLAGVGIPYGNSDALPYKKQFFIGGTNSIRAFPARSIGPGTYTPDEADANLLFFDQTGDIKLELNTELRFDIYGFLKGAVFIDAGNVWTVNPDQDRPGSQFNADTFYQELAIGTGLGVRVDASFFVLRVDWGLPLRDPAFIEEPWVINNFSSSNWRRDNIILNIGIGYPF